MKKIVIVLMLCLGLLLPAWAVNQEKKEEKPSLSIEKPVLRTFQLKYANPREILDLIRPFVYDVQRNENAKMLVVNILPDRIKALEELLAKLDVEKKSISLRIFTVIASQKPGVAPLELPELKGVIDELRNVLGYKNYELDGVSAINFQEGSRNNQIQLNSRIDGLTVELGSVTINSPQSGPRKLHMDLLLRIVPSVAAALPKDTAIISNTLIQTDTSINENGFLVAGVSRLASSKTGDALVLIINAVIK
jgi:hypothetical protein